MSVRIGMIVALSIAVAGCGGDDTATGPQGDGGASADLATGGGGGGDAGGGGGGDMAMGGGATKAGSVTASVTPLPGGKAVTSVSASFSDGGSGSCTKMTNGPCVTQTCGMATAGTPASAGAIMISGGKMPVTIMPKADNTYAPFSDTMNGLYAGGEMLSFSGAGATVPAFMGMLTAPTSVQITMPAAPAAGKALAIDRATDLMAAWTGGAAGNAVLTFTPAPAGGMSSSVICTFKAADGMGTIPSAALMTIPAGMGSYSASVQSTSTVTAGNWNVYLLAISSAATPMGLPYAGQATFQ